MSPPDEYITGCQPVSTKWEISLSSRSPCADHDELTNSRWRPVDCKKHNVRESALAVLATMPAIKAANLDCPARSKELCG